MTIQKTFESHLQDVSEQTYFKNKDSIIKIKIQSICLTCPVQDTPESNQVNNEGSIPL